VNLLYSIPAACCCCVAVCSLSHPRVYITADRIYESITISKGKYVNVTWLTPADTPIGTVTPNAWTNVGVGISSFVSYADIVHDINIENKLNSITPIPKVIPAPVSENILTDVTEWTNYNVDSKSIVGGDAAPSDFVTEWKSNKITSSSAVTLEGGDAASPDFI
jgi:hypothetical protein